MGWRGSIAAPGWGAPPSGGPAPPQPPQLPLCACGEAQPLGSSRVLGAIPWSERTFKPLEDKVPCTCRRKRGHHFQASGRDPQPRTRTQPCVCAPDAAAQDGRLHPRQTPGTSSPKEVALCFTRPLWRRGQLGIRVEWEGLVTPGKAVAMTQPQISSCQLGGRAVADAQRGFSGP